MIKTSNWLQIKLEGCPLLYTVYLKKSGHYCNCQRPVHKITALPGRISALDYANLTSTPSAYYVQAPSSCSRLIQIQESQHGCLLHTSTIGCLGNSFQSPKQGQGAVLQHLNSPFLIVKVPLFLQTTIEKLLILLLISRESRKSRKKVCSLCVFLFSFNNHFSSMWF